MGKFSPTNVLQTETNSGLSIGFSFNGRYYHFETESKDLLDLNAVGKAVSAALADATVIERFVEIHQDSPYACYVFADPQVMQMLSAELFIPLEHNLNLALHAGEALAKSILEWKAN